MKYAIIENEPSAVDNLTRIISSLRPDWKLVFRTDAVEDAVRYFRGAPDAEMVFMDIELTDGSCFDIISSVDISLPVIFTTAYSEYAVKAFSPNGIDYLLKPITPKAVEAAVLKYEKWNSRAAAAEMPRKIRRILISDADSYFYVNVSDIVAAVSEEGYVFLAMSSGQRRMTDFRNLGIVEKTLDTELFFRVSRNMIVHIDSVVSVRKYFKSRLKVRIDLGSGEEEVVISPSRRDAFLEWLGARG